MDHKPSQQWQCKAHLELTHTSEEQVWSVLTDFFNIYKWLPGLDTSYGVEGVSGEPGCVRCCARFNGAPDGKKKTWVIEKLVEVDHSARRLSYEITDNNLGYSSYKATWKVMPRVNRDEKKMERNSYGFQLRPFIRTRVLHNQFLQLKLIQFRQNRLSKSIQSINVSVFASAKTPTTLEQPGGKMVVELVGAFNELTEKMNVISTSSSRLLFKSLKLSIPILQSLPLTPDGRSPLSKALLVALILADLQMDAEVISAGMLRDVLETGGMSIHEIKNQIGIGTAHLLHENLRVRQIPSKVETLDDDSASALRKFCLTYYDIRAVILELILKLDMMRHLDHFPKYKQQMLSLEVMKIYSPLAHAIGITTISLELEDLSFRYLFPYSYLYVDTWLRSHETGSMPVIDMYKEDLLQSLKTDPLLGEMVDDISIKGRYKSRFSTMKKVLNDGRKPEEVNDILGLRVILNPVSGDNTLEIGHKACYRTRKVIQSLWKEIPYRTKDYIAQPKENGYRSLHMAVDVSDNRKTRPLMEIQIRTTDMDTFATGGTASHSLYKGGLTDPDEARRLKAIMMAAAELAALRLGDIPSTNHRALQTDHRDQVFRLLDKNGDGRISIEELKEVMEELGAAGDDAQEMMQLLDANSDGSLSSDEFDTFQKQVELMRNLEDTDNQYRTMLSEKLQTTDSSGLIQVYRKELDDRLALRDNLVSDWK